MDRQKDREERGGGEDLRLGRRMRRKGREQRRYGGRIDKRMAKRKKRRLGQKERDGRTSETKRGKGGRIEGGMMGR